MSPRSIDLPRARQGLARLDALVAAHPELRAPEAQARLATWFEQEEHRMLARTRKPRGDLKTRARVQRLREKRKHAGWQQAEVWFDPATAGLLAQLRQPGESLARILQRALQALAAQEVSQEQQVTRNTTTPAGRRQNHPKNGPTRKPQ
jgi:hypothetical protein